MLASCDAEHTPVPIDGDVDAEGDADMGLLAPSRHRDLLAAGHCCEESRRALVAGLHEARATLVAPEDEDIKKALYLLKEDDLQTRFHKDTEESVGIVYGMRGQSPSISP